MTGDLYTDLVALCTGFYYGMKKNRKAIVMSLCAAENHKEIRQIVSSGPEQQEKILGEFFSALKSRKVMRDLDPVIVARQLIEMLFGLCVSSGIRKSSAAETEAIIQQFVDVLILGIKR